MKVQYDHWYTCKLGNMPEDFEDIEWTNYRNFVKTSTPLIIIRLMSDGRRRMYISPRITESDEYMQSCREGRSVKTGPMFWWQNLMGKDSKVIAWKISSPYIEEEQ